MTTLTVSETMQHCTKALENQLAWFAAIGTELSKEKETAYSEGYERGWNACRVDLEEHGYKFEHRRVKDR